MRIATTIPRLFGMLIYWMGLHPWIIRLNRRRPKVLLYHACDEEESDFTRDLGSNTPPSLFERHLEFLARHYRVVPLSAVEADPVPEGAVVITFDDGYRSVYEHAFPLLRARGMAATVYLVADVVGGGRLVWVNELNALLRRGGDPALRAARRRLGARSAAGARELVAAAQARYDPGLIQELIAELRGLAPVPPDRPGERLYLGWEEVEEMAGHQITFGNHTASHPSLARLSESAQRLEIAGGREPLARRLGDCRTLAYPFGDHDAVSRRLAAELGHTTVMEVGCVGGPLRRDRIGRIPVMGTSEAELFAEIEVVAPLKAALARWLHR